MLSLILPSPPKLNDLALNFHIPHKVRLCVDNHLSLKFFKGLSLSMLISCSGKRLDCLHIARKTGPSGIASLVTAHRILPDGSMEPSIAGFYQILLLYEVHPPIEHEYACVPLPAVNEKALVHQRQPKLSMRVE